MTMFELLRTDFLPELSDYLNRQRGWLVDLLSQCISYPSVSGNEQEVMLFIKDLLGTLQGELSEVPVSEDLKGDPDYSTVISEQAYNERPNLIHLRRRMKKGKNLIVSGHTDVVPANWAGAFVPRFEEDAICGRGACDDKGPLFAWLLALRALDHFGLQLLGDLETHIVIEEEVGGNGALSLICGGRRADGVIVLEPSELHIDPAGRGALWFRIDIEGRSTHMASIQDGVSAVKEGIKVVQALERYEQWLLEDSRDNHLFARYDLPVMVNIGILNGGDWPSTLPAQATIEGGVGFLPNRTLEVVREEIRRAVLDETGSWIADHHRLSFNRLHNEAYQIDSDHPLVSAMKAAATHAELSSEICGMAASCDARLYFHRGKMPVIVFGPGSLKDAHSQHELIRIPDIINAAKALVYMTDYWCNHRE